MKFYIEMNADEIKTKIPYALICETRDGARWDTGSRKREWDKIFTEKEKAAATKIFRQARNWYLYKGVPDHVVMTPATLMLWKKLGMFCTLF